MTTLPRTPTTAAGRALLRLLAPPFNSMDGKRMGRLDNEAAILAIEDEARAEGRREFAPLVNREHEKHAAAEAALAESRAPLDVELRDAVQAHIDWLYRQPGARRFTLTDLRAAIAREYAKE